MAQQNGVINAYTIQKNGPNNYSVSATESIQLIKNIPNHDDNGVLNSSVTTRQITGILVVGTAANPVIYVTSSDSRIGGGGTAGDKNLDTNSGIVSKLTKSGSSWVKVDVVKGLPRSEENHSSNGLALDAATNILYVAQGGHTNAGSPSNNFAFITEFALSAAILKIDLTAITNQFGGSYTLPTLDDPSRANSGPNGADLNDPWGGNDGLNQAKLVAGGPVQIHSAGYRNAYDLVITKAPGKTGRMYTIDNGANGGWGGYPDKEGTSGVTNKYVTGEPGSTTAGVNDAKVNNLDNLHLVSAPGMTPIYGGHPNPIRANPAGAGIYTFNNTTGVGTFSLTPTADWPPVPVSMAKPVEADYRNPGVNDGALYTWPASTNGIAEYTSTAFNGAMTGDLLAASFDGNIYRIKLNTAGTAISNVSILAGGFGSQPLDVTAQAGNAVFPGTIWAATYGANSITILEPAASSNCTGDINNFNLDDDNDGYSNGDETANGTDPCSAASKPDDFDGDFISNLRDSDDDGDGLSDIVDKFAWDKLNGTTTDIPLDYPFLNGNPGFGFFGLGFTGLMTNNTTNYQNNFDPNKPNLVMGGAVGIATVPAEAGDPTTNNQKYAFQFGIDVKQSTPAFTIRGKLLGSSFFDGATGSQLGTQSQGIYFGTGDQDNYMKIVLHANNGNPGFQILIENNGVVSYQNIFPVANILSASAVDVFFDINPANGAVQCKYQTNSASSPVNIGPAITLTGNMLTAVQNNNALAVGLIASAGNKTPFTASWDYFKITSSALQSLTEVIRINAGGPAIQFGTQQWKADQYFTGGSVFSTTTAIS
ncbi:hypothetical protein GZH53_06305, partial [Flavihumibacter sp. R14]|nr:hypothetical protein [Flavihumibacter soli]